MIHTQASGPRRDHGTNRAQLRQYVGAYFKSSGWCTTAAVAFQLGAVALATLPQLRSALAPYSHWIVLVLALVAPLARWFGETAKQKADGILRSIEWSDGMGTHISRIAVEETIEDASPIVRWLATSEPLELKPYASDRPPGPARLLQNVQESAWWSARLGKGLARWESRVSATLGVICVGALYHLATSTPNGTTVPPFARDIAEFAATLLVFIFAEGYYRRSCDFEAFARVSERVVAKSTGLLGKGGNPSDATVLELAMEYFLARQAAPRIWTFYYRQRQGSLNAAWARACADDGITGRERE